MKNIVLILSLFLTSMNIQCQDTNILGAKDYNNIKINNVKLIALKNTLGKSEAIEALLGKPNLKEIDPDGEGSYFEFDGFSIGFSAIISDGTIEKPILGGFHITDNKATITIKGKTVTIGDNISKLGNVIFNTNNDNTKGILYMSCKGCNNFIYIDFNQTTKRITKIGYIEMT